MKVKITDIKLGTRQRRTLGDIGNLVESIKKLGLIHAVVIDDQNVLLAGERRLEAHKRLKLTTIDAVRRDDLDDISKRELELEENICRADITWPDRVQAVKAIHELKQKIYGKAVLGKTGGWGLRETAESLHKGLGRVSEAVQLADALDDHPELLKADSQHEAWKTLQKTRERMARTELAKRMTVSADIHLKSTYVKGDCRDVMSEIDDGDFDLIYADPPFAVALDKVGKFTKAWGREAYPDNVKDIMLMLHGAFQECYRILKNNRHAYFWFGIQHYAQVRYMLEEVGFYVHPLPIIWNKGQGGQGGTLSSYVMAYEACFMCTKGKRDLINYQNTNVLSYSRVTPQFKIHPAEKPIRLVQHMIEASTEPGEIVFDPFCGSGVSIRAAYKSKRKAMGCEQDEDYYASTLISLEAFFTQLGEVETDEELDEVVIEE